jgi:type IX secretion system PorP/SprF family membrane protein
MKKLLLTVFVIMAVFEGTAQQQPLLSQYMLNHFYFNPAYTSSGELCKFTILHRAQWSGYKDYAGNTGAPEIQMFTATANLDSTGHGFGLLLSRDKSGLVTTFQAQISYAYRIRITDKSTLAMGFRGGITTRSVEDNSFIVKHPNDKFIQEGKQSETQPDVTLGLFYDHEKYYLGVSANGLVPQADFNTLGLRNEKTIMLTGGYHIAVGHEWKLTPITQTITTIDRTIVQGGAVVNHADMFWAGLTYRHEEAATALIGFNLLKGKALVSYAFDYTTGNQFAKGSTSQEFMIAYRLGKLHPKRKREIKATETP